jgi:hypothetical protein
MPRDIDTVISRIRALHPDAKIEQLKVVHPGADDDGLWFFSLPPGPKEIQVESSTGAAPFRIEHSDLTSSSEAIADATLERTVLVVAAYLDRVRNLANKSPETTRGT